MSENPLDKLFNLVVNADLLSLGSQGIDTARRSLDGLIETAENFAKTMDNLNATTTRVNALLDEIEEPLKRVLAQMGTGLGVMANVGDNAAALAEVLKRLSPLTSLAEGATALFSGRPAASGSNAPTAAPETSERTES